MKTYGLYTKETENLINSIGKHGINVTIGRLELDGIDAETSENYFTIHYCWGLQMIVNHNPCGEHFDHVMSYSFFNREGQCLIENVTLTNQKGVNYEQQKQVYKIMYPEISEK